MTSYRSDDSSSSSAGSGDSSGEQILWSDIPTWNSYTSRNSDRISRSCDKYAASSTYQAFKQSLTVCPAPSLGDRVSLWAGSDLTLLKAGAIVNAANEELRAGGGICGAIFQRAGRQKLARACNLIRFCATGSACITPGFDLPAEHVVHTVGPMNTDRAALQSCYVSTLDLIKSKSIQTIGFCAISTGIYGFPREEAAAVALGTTRRWLEDGDNAAHIDRIIFSTFSDQDTEIYEAYMSAAFGACDQSQSS